MNEIRCKTCRSWGTPDEADDIARTCQKIIHRFGYMSGDLAYAASRHDSCASFMTREDFGCILYQDSKKEAS